MSVARSVDPAFEWDAIPTARLVRPAFRWDAVTAWILEWEVSDDADDVLLERWNADLAEAATLIDSNVIWCPQTDTVTAPAGYDDDHVAALLRRCIAGYAGIDI
ncbi:hypothetical protein [Rhodococcus olei]|uniref:hypothetical protein n=1 Tax=Rhodococcus olei TaxID=2161675 RepID=UPI0031EF46E5